MSDTMRDNFYRAFEERNRGPRELIASRLKAYLPFLAPFKADGAPFSAIDLGCGRGEWLEMLRDEGYHAAGVDMDEGMLQGCRERGLNARHGDALAALRELPDASMNLVSAFHLVEHMAFDDVRALIREALRVLKPAGLLILETPNPENIVVGTSLFYLDPTHLRPIPPELLSFAVEFEGFQRNTVMRLQEQSMLHGQARLELINVFAGASPDYAVVGQKEAAPERLAEFDKPFAASYGITLAQLTHRYQTQQENRLDQFAASYTVWSAHVENRMRQADEAAKYLDGRDAALEVRLARLEGWLSWLWRISAPLRWARKQAGLLRRDGPGSRIAALARKLPGRSAATSAADSESAHEAAQTPDLPPRTQRIYEDLKAGIERKQERSGQESP